MKQLVVFGLFFSPTFFFIQHKTNMHYYYLKQHAIYTITFSTEGIYNVRNSPTVQGVWGEDGYIAILFESSSSTSSSLIC